MDTDAVPGLISFLAQLNGDTVAESESFTPPAGYANINWFINLLLTIYPNNEIRALGGYQFHAIGGDPTSAMRAADFFESGSPIDPTIQNPFDLQVQWELAKVANTITCEIFILELI
jgi:hypothetical protein